MLFALKLIAVIVAFAGEVGPVDAMLEMPKGRPAEVRSFGPSNRRAVPQDYVPRAEDMNFRTSEGFLFVDEQYYPPATTLSWQADELRIDSSTASMLACLPPSEDDGPMSNGSLNDSANNILELSAVTSLAINGNQLRAIRSMLEDGGIVILSKTRSPYLLDQSRGGLELIESLTHQPGPKRESLLNSAFAMAHNDPGATVRSWLSNMSPGTDLINRASKVVSEVHKVENTNMAAASAFKRFHNWSYPITVMAMVIFVFSIGSLLAVRPQELVAVARTEHEISVNKFLWLIGAMSIIDLVWTLLAHQANHITEVNPVGGVMLDEPSRVILFKVLATGLAIGILYRAKTTLFGRKACWWVCLTLALLMARWILVTGVSA